MPNPPNTEDQAATEYDAHRTARKTARRARPETDPDFTQPGARAYEDLPVEGESQRLLLPGASEPSDMGHPKEHVGGDGTGYRG